MTRSFVNRSPFLKVWTEARPRAKKWKNERTEGNNTGVPRIYGTWDLMSSVWKIKPRP